MGNKKSGTDGQTKKAQKSKAIKSPLHSPVGSPKGTPMPFRPSGPVEVRDAVGEEARELRDTIANTPVRLFSHNIPPFKIYPWNYLKTHVESVH